MKLQNQIQVQLSFCIVFAVIQWLKQLIGFVWVMCFVFWKNSLSRAYNCKNKYCCREIVSRPYSHSRNLFWKCLKICTNSIVWTLTIMYFDPPPPSTPPPSPPPPLLLLLLPSSPRWNKYLFAIICWNIGHLNFWDRRTDRPTNRPTKQGIEAPCRSLKNIWI